MTDQPPTTELHEAAQTEPASYGSGSAAGAPGDRPEVAVGAAFAGGLVLALIFKRLAR